MAYACKHDEILELNQPIRIQFQFEMAEISRAAIRRLLFEMKAIVISPVNAGVLSVQRFENMSLQECCLRGGYNYLSLENEMSSFSMGSGGLIRLSMHVACTSRVKNRK